MYKKARTTGLESDKQELKKMKSIMQKKVREAKNAQFENYISEMDQLGLTEAKNVTSRILKAESQREGQNKALGAPVHPRKFSAYVSSVCRAEKDWNTNLERFTVNEAVRRNLKAAFKKST